MPLALLDFLFEASRAARLALEDQSPAARVLCHATEFDIERPRARDAVLEVITDGRQKLADFSLARAGSCWCW